MEEMRSLTAFPSKPPISVPRKPLELGSLPSQKSTMFQEGSLNNDDDDDYDDNDNDNEAAAATYERSPPPEEQEENSKSQPLKDRHHLTWIMEIASLLLATVAFVAIVITLTIHRNRPLPQWPHLVSINTLVAIFTAVLKASLLLPVVESINQLKWQWFLQPRPLGDLEQFDSASRGPWGSLLFLFSHSGRNLAAVGATITIVAMAIDPFSQQIIHYYDCLVLVPGAVSTIPISNFYSAGSYFVNGGDKIPDNSMTAALYTGLLDPPTNASSGITSNCLSGNCSFRATNGASYSSLAMCSHCSDVSHEIHNGSYLDQGTLVQNFTLSSGCQLGYNGVVLSSFVLDFSGQQQDLTATSLISFESLMYTGSIDTPLAIRCSLNPCVKTYGGNITNSILQENLISSEPLLFVDMSSFSYFSVITNQTVSNGQYHDCTPTPYATSENSIPLSVFVTPFNGSNGNEENKSFYRADCVFTLGPISTMGLSGSLYSSFFNNQTVQLFDSIPTGDIWMTKLFNNFSASLQLFETTMTGLAESITIIMRQQGDNSTSAPAVGTVSVQQTCIGVQWLWLSLPATLLLLTVMFLAATRSKMSFRHVRYLWKSSALVLLFHGFSTQTLQSGAEARFVGHIAEEKARRTRAQLKFADGEWAFVKSYGYS